MFNNCMRFGDITVKQISKVAMGMSPVPNKANLYVAIHEEMHVLKYIPAVVLNLCCFIDDAWGYGLMTQIQWLTRGTGKSFKTA